MSNVTRTRENKGYSNKIQKTSEHSFSKKKVEKNEKHIPYSDKERERIQSLLNKVLGPEYVSFRPGGGGQKVSYIEGWKALNLANEIFGFDGWSSELMSTQVDYFDTHKESGKVSIGLSVIVRITIKDGTFHEDFGYGYIDNAKNKAMAFEKCKKEAFTDGLKRCLRCFGNVLGNCLYDRGIISKIQKVRLPAPELEDSDFYRHPLIGRAKSTAKVNSGTNIYNSEDGRQIDVLSRSKIKENNSSVYAVDKLTSPAISGDKDDINIQDTNRNNHERSREDRKKSGSNNYDIADFDDSLVFSDDVVIDEDVEYDHGLDDYEMQMLVHRTGKEKIKSKSSNGEISVPIIDEERSANKDEDMISSEPAQNSLNIEKHDNIPEYNTMFISAKKADLLRDSLVDTENIPLYDHKSANSNLGKTVDQTKSTPVKRAEASSAGIRLKPLPLVNKPTNSESIVTSKKLVGIPPSQRGPYNKPKK